MNTPAIASTTKTPTAMARRGRFLDPLAGKANQRGQQRDGRQHHHQHADRAGHSQPADEGETDDEQAEQRDHHGDAGEDDGATGRVDRLHDGLLRLHAIVEVLAVPGDDEQGVVDADADTDHGCDLR